MATLYLQILNFIKKNDTFLIQIPKARFLPFELSSNEINQMDKFIWTSDGINKIYDLSSNPLSIPFLTAKDALK